MTLLDDLQRTYNQTKVSIVKEMADLETILNPEQLQEIKESLITKFKQLAPVYMEKKQGQYKKPNREQRFQRRQKTGIPNRSEVPPQDEQINEHFKIIIKLFLSVH